MKQDKKNSGWHKNSRHDLLDKSRERIHRKPGMGEDSSPTPDDVKDVESGEEFTQVNPSF